MIEKEKKIETILSEIAKERKEIKDSKGVIDSNIKKIIEKISKQVTGKGYGVNYDKFYDRIMIYKGEELPLEEINNMMDDLGIKKELIIIGGDEEKANIIGIKLEEDIDES